MEVLLLNPLSKQARNEEQLITISLGENSLSVVDFNIQIWSFEFLKKSLA